MFNPRVWVLAAIALIIYFGFFSAGDIFSGKGDGGTLYNSYNWNSDTSLVFSGVSQSKFSQYHAYDITPSQSKAFCDFNGVSEGLKVCANNEADFKEIIKDGTCVVKGKWQGCYEGEGCSGSGNYELPGTPDVISGVIVCKVSYGDEYKEQTREGSEIYRSWYSTSNRVVGWQYLSVTSGIVEFQFKAKPAETTTEEITQETTQAETQEGITEEVKATTKQATSWFSNILNSIINFIKGIFT